MLDLQSNPINALEQRMLELEDTKYLNRMFCIIYKNNKPVGFCNTSQEADQICDKNYEYQWSYSKIDEKRKKLQYITIHDI